jgi:hypothetical protein
VNILVVSLIFLLLTENLRSQEYRFVSRGDSFALVQDGPRLKPRKVKPRSLPMRLLLSIRPWVDAPRYSRITYEWTDEHLFLIEGGYGVGLQAKIEF